MTEPVTHDAPQSEQGCPDEASCHHRCMVGCWRVANDTPLPSSGRDTWPPSVRREYGIVVQAGAASISAAFAQADSSPAGPATGGPERDPEPTGELADPAPPAGEEPTEQTASEVAGRLRTGPAYDEPVVVVPDPPLMVPPEPAEVYMHGPDGQGIPIIDLNAQLASLDQTVVALRGWSKVLGAYSEQAAQWADGLAHLRSTLNGDT